MSTALQPSPQPSPLPSPQRRGTFSLRSSSSSTKSSKSNASESSKASKLVRMFSLTSSKSRSSEESSNKSQSRRSSGEKSGASGPENSFDEGSSIYGSDTLSRRASLEATSMLAMASSSGTGGKKKSVQKVSFERRPEGIKEEDPETPTLINTTQMASEDSSLMDTPRTQTTFTASSSTDPDPQSSKSHLPASPKSFRRQDSTSTGESDARRQVGVVALPSGQVNLISPKGSIFPHLQSTSTKRERHTSEPSRYSVSVIPTISHPHPTISTEEFFKLQSTPILPAPSPSPGKGTTTLRASPSQSASSLDMTRPGIPRTRSISAPSPAVITPNSVYKEYLDTEHGGYFPYSKSPDGKDTSLLSDESTTIFRDKGKRRETNDSGSVYSDMKIDRKDTTDSVYSNDKADRQGTMESVYPEETEVLDESIRRGSESSVYPDDGMNGQDERRGSESTKSVYEDTEQVTNERGMRHEKGVSATSDLFDSLQRSSDVLARLEGGSVHSSEFAPRHERQPTTIVPASPNDQDPSALSHSESHESLHSHPSGSGSEMMDELEGLVTDAINNQINVKSTPPPRTTSITKATSLEEITPTKNHQVLEERTNLNSMARSITTEVLTTAKTGVSSHVRDGSRRHSIMTFSTPPGKENTSGSMQQHKVVGLNRPYPPAMDYSGIKNLRTTSERAVAYAKKINELSREDTGLHIWLSCIKEQQYGPSLRSVSNSTVQHGHMPIKGHPRDFSAASSEFPTRPDAYKAKELTRSPLAQSQPLTVSQRVYQPPSRTSTSIPYPGALPRRHSNNSSLSTPNTLSRATIAGKSTSSFFSTLGRKGSRRAPVGVLQKPQAGSAIMTSTLNMGTLKGGPRMPYSSSNLSSFTDRDENSTNSPITKTPTGTVRQSMATARPAMQVTKSSFMYGSGKDDGIEDKLDKLADILPQATRDTLRTYLIKANGDDLVVVGQYLDDERTGKV